MPLVVVPPPTFVQPPTSIRPSTFAVERVLALRPALASAPAADWDAALPLPLLPAQAAAVRAAVAGRLPATLHVITLDGGVATAVARGDLAAMRVLSKANVDDTSQGAVWLDSTSAGSLIAAAFAALASERYLGELGDEMRDIKTAFAALPLECVTQAGPFKALVQDLSRFTREARDNYASVIGKQAFRERVVEAGERAVAFWREGVARADDTGQKIRAQLAAQRFAETRIETSLPLVRALQNQRRLQDMSARVLAAARLLRVAIGDLPTSAASDPLASALAALQAGAEQDRELAAKLVAMDVNASEPMATEGTRRLVQARDARPLDALGDGPKRLLVRRESGGGISLRWLGAV